MVVEDNYLPIPGEAYEPPRAFWRQECAGELVQILAIPLPLVPQKNVRAWSGEATGEYTVRNAYKWRLMNSANYPHSHNGVETVEHVFQECLHTKEIWQQLGFTQCTQMHMTQMAEWAIWTARNELLHEGQSATARETVHFIWKYLGEIIGVKRKIAKQIVLGGVWKTVQNPFVKINFDAGFCKQDNRSCSGITIRNNTGNILYLKTVLHANIPSPIAANALAYFQPILTGAQMGFLNVEVEGDCLFLIRNLKENRGERSVIRAYIHNIRASCVIF
ncbi:hypothetical protein PVK06_027494 [Gossypium arboreum]|uniref:RNase H type-1 domain-containing protein n=1 Tax=Gossypium arboreum TaxID=29729 RepID=A0ABR0P0E0_GOSAR|nr:hypothetical protein PVK06_027494 [Gossypium arboreum]